MTWTWQMRDSAGQVVPVAAPSQLTQSDAESWLGEHWRDLAADGVADVTLFEDGRLQYGPMSLSAD